MLWLDIETTACPDAPAFIEPGSPPANWKDPVKIAQWKADDAAKKFDKAALDPDLAQIIALAFLWDDDGDLTETVLVGDEAEILADAWERIALAMTSHALIGGKGLHRFDLRVMERRSQYLQVPYPKLPIQTRYPQHPVWDLEHELTYGDPSRMKTLGFYCKRAGIPHDDRVSGADIGRLWAQGDLEAIKAHALDDVRSTRLLAHRMGLL